MYSVYLTAVFRREAREQNPGRIRLLLVALSSWAARPPPHLFVLRGWVYARKRAVVSVMLFRVSGCAYAVAPDAPFIVTMTLPVAWPA